MALKGRIALLYSWPDEPSAERECIERIRRAAAELGVAAVLIDRCGYDLESGKEISSRDVDLVIHLHFETPKCYDAFSYATLWNPLDFFLKWGYRRLSEHVASHDDFLTCGSPWADDHLCRLIHGDKTRLPPVVPFHHSLAGPILPPRLVSHRTIFYCGINWEPVLKMPGRYDQTLRILDKKNVLRIHGPEEVGGVKVWDGFRSYAGALPYDGKSVVEEIARCGMALVFSSEFHKRSGLMTNRMFESAAAGALIICDDNPFARRHFGDSLLYVDTTRTPREVADAILRHYDRARENPQEACALARKAQAIFLDKFCLKKELAHLLTHHEERAEALRQLVCARQSTRRVRFVHVEFGATPFDDIAMPSLACWPIRWAERRLEPLFESLALQSYRNFDLTLVADESWVERHQRWLRQRTAKLPFSVSVRPASVLRQVGSPRPLGEIACEMLPEFADEDLVSLSCQPVRLFADHFSSMVRLFEDDPSLSVAFSDVLICQSQGDNELRELNCVRELKHLQDPLRHQALAHCLFRRDAVRQEHLPFLRYLDEWWPCFLARAADEAVGYTRRATVLQLASGKHHAALDGAEQALIVADLFPEVLVQEINVRQPAIPVDEARLRSIANKERDKRRGRKATSTKPWLQFITNKLWKNAA